MNNPSEVSRSAPKDVFMYLLGLVTLVMSAGSFGMLVYQYIDIRFPDILQFGYGGTLSANYGLIRTALAVLVVVFPVFFWVTRNLHKDVIDEPAKRDIRIRRWLLYFTVFVASLVVIGDLIALIQSFLNGDLTTSFILKVLTIFFIAGSTLFYYLSELHERVYPRKAFQAVIIGAVVLALGYGFYLAGSPQNQRLVRFDEQKISDLQSIQSYIVYNWWTQKGTLPKTLEELNNPISGFIVPLDPQSGEIYEYKVTDSKSFELCAVFNTGSFVMNNTPANKMMGVSNLDNWQHLEGRSCFPRTIDPVLYPVNPRGGEVIPLKY